MRSNVQVPQIGDEVLCVVTFVGAHGQGRGRGMRLVTALLIVEIPLTVAPWRGRLV
jgi:hypothetical protein